MANETNQDRHFVVDRTNGEWKARRSTFTYAPGDTETAGGMTREEAEEFAFGLNCDGL